MLSQHNKINNIPLVKFKIINFPPWGTVNIWSILHCQLCLPLVFFLPYKKEKVVYNFSYQQTISSWMHVSITVFLKYSYHKLFQGYSHTIMSWFLITLPGPFGISLPCVCIIYWFVILRIQLICCLPFVTDTSWNYYIKVDFTSVPEEPDWYLTLLNILLLTIILVYALKAVCSLWRLSQSKSTIFT